MFLLLNFLLLIVNSIANEYHYAVGTGMADITGPAAHVTFMGYAKFDQVACGIHTRLWSRAFIIGRDIDKIVFVSIDSGMISQLLKSKVVERLQHLFGDLYRDSNVCLSSTHTHSGPGGFFKDSLYAIPTLGFVQETFDAMLDGVVMSIVRAHRNLQFGFIYYNSGYLFNTSINRSPAAYEQNPENERRQYQLDIDNEMFLLKFTDLDGNGIGMINWFAVHATSMNSSNCLVSSDNKGYASLLFEEEMNGIDILPGEGKFVAAFAQSNEGDVSPNTKGPICVNNGQSCDFPTSTCCGQAKHCIGQGPGNDMFDNTRIIGSNQYKKALELWETAEDRLSGPIISIHRYIDMPKVRISDDNGKKLTGCSPAFGHSFGAGTTDGPGDFDFKQHTIVGNESTFWNMISGAIFSHAPDLAKCHHPKPLLITQKSIPSLWLPEIVPIQLLRIGNLIVVAAPGEFTTMAGRRLRNSIQSELNDKNVSVVIAGLSNSYTSYVTTREEYGFQRYEGASTLYGPGTLDIYIEFYKNIARNMIKNETLIENISPPSTDISKLIKHSPFTLFDSAEGKQRMGKLIADAKSIYRRGETVKVTFISSNPSNGVKLRSFFYIERYDIMPDFWVNVASDANWDTKFEWKITNRLLGQSESTIYWSIPINIKQGTYRIRFQGVKKGIFKNLIPYSGKTRDFLIDDSM